MLKSLVAAPLARCIHRCILSAKSQWQAGSLHHNFLAAMALGIILCLARPTPAAPPGKPDPHSSIVVTRDGKSYKGEIKFTDAGVIVTPVNSRPITVETANLKDLVVAENQPVVAVESEDLPGGWKIADLGSPAVQTVATFSKETFTVKAVGTQLGGTADSGGAVLLAVGEQSELVAHVLAIPMTDTTAKAGITCRKDASAEARGASLVVQAGGGVQFIGRKADHADAVITNGPASKSPCWLKLVHKDLEITGFISADGRTWAKVGSVTVADELKPEEKAKPREAPRANPTHPAPLAVMGLIVSSGRAYEPSSVGFDHVRMQTQGLLGEYFSDDHLSTMVLSRIDPMIDMGFKGKEAQADPASQIENLAARWQGNITCKNAGTYSFNPGTQGAYRLWIDGKVVSERAWKLPPEIDTFRMTPKLELKPGTYKIKLEWIESNRTGVALKWQYQGPATMTVVPSEALSYVFDSTDKQWAAPESRTPARPTTVAATAPATLPAVDLNVAPLVRGLQTREGSFLAGNIGAYDPKTDNFAFFYKGNQAMRIPTDKISRLVYKPLTPDLLAKLPEHSTGALLHRGDFVEGEFSGFENGKIKISSVILGFATFTPGDEAMLLQIHDIEREKPAYVVRTNSGSVFLAQSIAFGNGTITCTDPIAGPIRIDPAELVDIRTP